MSAAERAFLDVFSDDAASNRKKGRAAREASVPRERIVTPYGDPEIGIALVLQGGVQ